MTKEQILQYLRERQSVLRISAIGKHAGVSNLSHVVSGYVNKNGYPAKLADKHKPALLKEIERLQIK